MKARLIPVFFPDGKDANFDVQLGRLKQLLAEEAEFLTPVALGSQLPETDAVVFPQLLGEAYRKFQLIEAIDLPLLIITSEFGTVSMWDWEIASYLRSKGVDTIAPYNLDQAKKVCKALGVKRELKESRFLVYQDNPGEGHQADIFKRFYWWEDECIQRMLVKFGVTLVKKSFKAMAADARQIPDKDVEAVKQKWQLITDGVSEKMLNSALKVYLRVKQDIDDDPGIRAVGINCLNESSYSDTTPCLAWNLLYREKQLIWGCEADHVSMLTKYILHRALGAAVMMTNLYPFLMGQAALKHERIPDFPKAEEPQNHILAAHCGYFGVVPEPFASEWTLRPKVLAIVDDNATAIDARMPAGKITLAKLDASFDILTVIEGELEGYTQYPGSDCRNGAVIKVSDGHRLVANIASHHYIIVTGHHRADIENLARVFNLDIDQY